MAGELYTPTDFWSQVSEAIQTGVYESMGQRMFVDSVSGGLVRLKDMAGRPGGVAAYLGIEALSANQEVWVEPVATKFADGRRSQLLSWIVVGPVRRVAPTTKNIDGTILKLLGGMDLILTSDSAGSTTVFSVDGATGDMVVRDIAGRDGVFRTTNTPFATVQSQSSPDATSTTSTSTYSSAMSVDVVLPAGTWNVKTLVFLGMNHSAGQQSNLRAEVDGTVGTARVFTCPSSGFRMGVDEANVGSISGSRTIVVSIAFKSSDAGTTTVNNPGAIIISTRTG